ncbi:hypothetical protein, partial [Paraburkholderia sp. SIMBA_027]|uniref:hypothetical protein n=1 Tax=Paraburkholderia sp. SIMBA_027 TaxID=3085770 RepID=UPI00397C0BE2
LSGGSNSRKLPIGKNAMKLTHALLLNAKPQDKPYKLRVTVIPCICPSRWWVPGHGISTPGAEQRSAAKAAQYD